MLKALLLTIFFALAASGHAKSQAQWDQVDPGRPLLHWETLRGYRLFFHPDHPDPLRQAVGVGIRKRYDLEVAFALARPWHMDSPRDTWLRIEGRLNRTSPYVTLDWNGVYRGKEFPDHRYWYDVTSKLKGRASKTWKVPAVKSKDHPRFRKIAGQKLAVRELDWDSSKGEFKPRRTDVFLSRAEHDQVELLAKVWLPELDEDFRLDGVLVQARQIESDFELAPAENPQWQCICQQSIPENSPARKKAKTVRCNWNLQNFDNGLWELRVGLWHHQKHPHQQSACDVPVLDEDRIHVRIRP